MQIPKRSCHCILVITSPEHTTVVYKTVGAVQLQHVIYMSYKQAEQICTIRVNNKFIVFLEITSKYLSILRIVYVSI
jgi:hypothetical protein